MVDHWVYYDADANRVPSKSAQAKFQGKEVATESGVPASQGHHTLRRYRYVDVHAIGSSQRHTFESWTKFRNWCKEQSRL